MTHTHTPAVFAPYDSPLYVCSLALYALALDAACACGMLSYGRVVALHVLTRGHSSYARQEIDPRARSTRTVRRRALVQTHITAVLKLYGTVACQPA